MLVNAADMLKKGIFRRQRGRGQQGRRRDAGQQPAHPIVLHVMCSSRRIVKLAFHMYCKIGRASCRERV